MIDKALDYVVKNLSSIDDNYTLAIVTYAMHIAKHPSKDSLLAKLDEKSENSEGKKYWQNKDPEGDQARLWIRPNSLNVEMTSYALLAFIEADRALDGIQIMKWLLEQRNKNGDFASTQDTVVGLQALTKQAAIVCASNRNVVIEVKPDQGSSKTFKVDNDNDLVLQKHEMPSNSRSFEVSATGHGLAILQMSHKFNISVVDEEPRFILKPKVKNETNKNKLHLTVGASFVSDSSYEKSNMAIMEVTLPSGYTFENDSRQKLEKTMSVKKVETKNGETVVVIYFHNIGPEKIYPELTAYRTHSVAMYKPVPVIIYDYYDNCENFQCSF